MYSKSFKPSPDLVVGTVSAASTGATGGGYGAIGGASSTCTVDTVMSSSLTMYSSHDLSGMRQEHKHQGTYSYAFLKKGIYCTILPLINLKFSDKDNYVVCFRIDIRSHFG